MPMETPEEKARKRIDKQLNDAGWEIVPRDEYVPHDTQAVKEALMLEAAMHGLLTEQQDNDGDIAELLESIETTRLGMQKAKTIKKPKAMPPITPDEIPFDFPPSWKLVRLSDVAWFGGGHTPSMSDASNFCDGGTLWVTSKDMKVDRLASTQITLTEKGASTLTRYPAGTVLMVTRSGILRRKLPVAILEREATVNQDQKAIVPFEPGMAEWLFVYLKACDSFIRHNFGKTGATVESVVFDRVKELPIAIPPLAEQKRIVDRVEKLLQAFPELARK